MNLSRNEPTPCVECERMGCPTEGMTLMCHECASVICAGHQRFHKRRAHNLTDPSGHTERPAPPESQKSPLARASAEGRAIPDFPTERTC